MLGRRKPVGNYASYFTYYRPPKNYLEILNHGIAMAKETVVDFRKDYLGQKEIRLCRAYPFEEPKYSQEEVLELWANYLSKHDTKLRKVEVVEANQEVLNALSRHKQIEQLEFIGGSFYDLKILATLPNLKYLTFEDTSENIDFSCLSSVNSLKALRAFARVPLNYESISKLTQLEGLEIGAGIDVEFRGSIKVSSFDFLRPLVNLKKLWIGDVRPIDKDLTALLSLDNLEEGWYVTFRGQFPSVADMAKAHPAFKKVHDTYLEIQSWDK
jgi:hypothetical protein